MFVYLSGCIFCTVTDGGPRHAFALLTSKEVR